MQINLDTDPLLDAREAGRKLRKSDRTLENWRRTGDGPAFLKLGRAVFYRTSDLEEWIATCRRRSTSDPGTAA